MPERRGAAATSRCASVRRHQVNVPLEFRKAVEATPRSSPYATTPAPAGMPFEVTIAFGKRFEPWIAAAGSR